MKKTIIAATILFSSLLATGSSAQSDRPEKGEWDLNARQIWTVDGAGIEAFGGSFALKVAQDGSVYLWDRKNFKFFVFDPDGKFLFSFGRKGEGPGELRYGVNFFLVGGQVIVFDYDRLTCFDSKGAFLRSEMLPRPGFEPLAFVDENRFVTSPMLPPDAAEQKEKLLLYDLKQKKESLLTEYIPPPAMKLETSSGGSNIRLVMRLPGLTPEMTAAYGGGRIAYGKSDVYEIAFCDLSGKNAGGISLQRERQKIDTATKVQLLPRSGGVRITINREGGGDAAASGPSKEQLEAMARGLPDYTTFFRRIEFTSKGWVYVFLTNFTSPHLQAIDIFSPEGKYKYRATFTLPAGSRISSSAFVIASDHAFVAFEDPKGEYWLAKFKINLPEK